MKLYTTFLYMTPNLPVFTYFRKHIRDYMISLTGLLFPFVGTTLKTYISAFLDFHIQSLTKTVKSYIKDTNNFFRKLEILGQLLENAILCTIDAVYLYPNIPYEESLFLRKTLT